MGSSAAAKGHQHSCILCKSVVDGKIKWEKRWRENIDRGHGEGGPPKSIYSYL